MSTHRPTLALVLAAVAALSLAACSGGGGGASASGGTSSQSGGGALAALKASGVLKVGTEGTYAPFTYHDSTTGDLTGYDVEVITAVADKLGVKPEFNEVKWDAIFAGLEARRYDIIANEVTENADRTAKYDLSDVYSVSYPVALVAADNSSLAALGDVKGKKSAQTATSNWGQLATDNGAQLVAVDGFTEAVAALRDGRVDLTFNDNLAALSYFSTTKDTTVKIGFELPDQAVHQVFALRKDSGLVDAVNSALKELRADGTLAKISQKYFGSDISSPETATAQPSSSSSTSSQSGK